MQMFTLLLGDQSCKVQLKNEHLSIQEYILYVNLSHFDRLLNNKKILIWLTGSVIYLLNKCRPHNHSSDHHVYVNQYLNLVLCLWHILITDE